MATENYLRSPVNHIINHLFSDEYQYDGNTSVDTSVVLVRYNSDKLEFAKLSSGLESYLGYCKAGYVNWFDVVGLNNTGFIHRILLELGFFDVDAKSVLTPCHAAKIDDFDKRLIIVIRPSYFEHNNRIASEHICILLKGNILLTFRERGNISFDHVVKSLRTNVMQIRQRDKGLLLAFILNSILSVMIGTAVKVEEMLGNIDLMLLENSSNDNMVGKKIQHCSYANLYLQKTVVPLKDEFDKLIKIPFIREGKGLMPVYMELYNQLDYILLTSKNCRDLLGSLRDLYVSNNDLKTNTVMKRLTVVATLFIPLTFLAGLWGMNFEFMPETKWEYGYVFAWVVMGLTVMLTWRFMKRHKWF
ncbi:MAG: magnesium and cobalt transport protein CorA [Tannerellaceae bacterium]|nr:magnesium and cobalt transport protein CorA [Tannerellaceae bacterium]MCD8263007.1 magnesium and cobalt transport protein CorA [Tannerellaceae bacterium]